MTKSQRQVWGETLVNLAKNDERCIVLDDDLANSTQAALVATEVPESFIEVGIAEQNMVGMAFGLATLGYRPWLSTFSVFLTHRALDQVRMHVSQTMAPVRLAGAYSGLLNRSSGKTHQDIEDFAIMRGMPNMSVLVPADEYEAEAVTRWAADHDGPVFVRYARDAVEPVYDTVPEFTPGASVQLREGQDLVLVSTGVQTSRVLQAAALLADRGLDATVIHVPTLKPFDRQLFFDLAGGPANIVTVEEHGRAGGLGGLISEIVAEQGIATRVTRIGLTDKWSESAPNDFLLDKYGLSPQRVAEAVLASFPPRR
jgi:transketolase